MKNKTKYASVLASTLLFAVIGAGCGEVTESTGTKVDEAETTTETNEEATVEDTVFKVGDVVNLNGMELTIVDAKFVDPSEYSAPEKGKVLQMNVNFTNNTDDSAFIDSTDFNLYDTEGNSLEAYYGLDTMDISGDVNKGKKLQGTLTFDVPEGTNYELIYEPTFSWTEESITWDITPQ